MNAITAGLLALFLLLHMTNNILKIISPYTLLQYVTILFFMHKTTSFLTLAKKERRKLFVSCKDIMLLKFYYFWTPSETERVKIRKIKLRKIAV
jgi:hypothetical protein